MKSNTEHPTSSASVKSTFPFWQKIFSPKAPTLSRKALPFKPIDWITMIGISLFYAYFAFSNLGNTFAPQTEELFPENAYIEMTVSDDSYIDTVYWCLWDIPEIVFKLEVKNTSDAEWTHLSDLTVKGNFSSWNGLALPYPVQQVRLTNTTGRDTLIGEFGIRDVYGNLLQPLATATYPKLFDEQNTVPEEINHLSSYYFDEVLYVETVYDFINLLPTYECTHPPFGKILMTLGTLRFGFTPFGIRFPGALFGVLMLHFLYLLGRNITQNRVLGAFICFLFAFDFMHFTQTRLATLDVFVTFFIIVMYYFMERYINLSFYDTSLKKTWLPLGFCGIAFGFGIASKWTGFYAGAGLAILFFTKVLNYYREYRYALLTPDETTHDISHRHIINTFKQNTCKTILFCIVFFVCIPFLIYTLTYIPFLDIQNQGLLDKMIANQQYMFTYHSEVELSNPFSSRWYQWPAIMRPMLYYFQIYGGVGSQSICAMGNPLVWWVGIPAFIYILYLAIKKKEHGAIFLCIAYLAQYVPWIFIARMTFIYHYFPCVPFLALMIGYCFLKLKDMVLSKKILDEKSFYCLVLIYAAASYGLFQMFLPVLSGDAVSVSYVDNYLQWFKDWTLTLI